MLDEEKNKADLNGAGEALVCGAAPVAANAEEARLGSANGPSDTPVRRYSQDEDWPVDSGVDDPADLEALAKAKLSSEQLRELAHLYPPLDEWVLDTDDLPFDPKDLKPLS